MQVQVLGAVILTIAVTLTGCITEGGGPLNTTTGKSEATRAYTELALGYIQQGQTELAKEPLLSALKIDENDAVVNATLAYVFQLEQDSKLADNYFKKAVSVDPNNARILNNYGAFLFKERRLDEAKQQFLKASEDSFYSERSMVFENLGFISLQQNRLTEAEQYFKRALSLNQQRIRSILALAEVYYSKGDYPKAQQYYDAFIAMAEGRQTPSSLLLGINIAKALNNKVKVASYALQLEQLYPSSIEYRQYKAGKK